MMRNSSDDAVFNFTRVSIPNPAAGSPNWQFMPPRNAHLSLVLFTCTYVADANVADRIISVGNWYSGAHHPLASVAYPIVAGETWTIIGSICPLPNSAVSHSVLYCPLPDIPFFHEGDYMSFLFTGAQATDQLSNLMLYFKLWAYET